MSMYDHIPESNDREARDLQLQDDFVAACAVGGIAAGHRLVAEYDVQVAALSAVLDSAAAIKKELAAGDDSALGSLTTGEFGDFGVDLQFEYADASLDYWVLSGMRRTLREDAPRG